MATAAAIAETAFNHLRLLPDGRVPVCQFNTETVGNLLHQSLEEIWQAAGTRVQRAWVDACPGCWAECEVMPSALYSGDLIGTLWWEVPSLRGPSRPNPAANRSSE